MSLGAFAHLAIALTLLALGAANAAEGRPWWTLLNGTTGGINLAVAVGA